MSPEQLISAVDRTRRRLRDHAHLFEDPASYVDGVEDALELVERVVIDEDADIGPPAAEDGLERTA
jgi:hypothetical protein